VLYSDGRYKEAEELVIEEMLTTKRVLGDEHPETLASMANLALTYRFQGRWKEAEELNVQVMQTRKRVLGNEHPDTLASIANLAATYRDQEHWDKAEELEVQVMQTNNITLGSEHLTAHLIPHFRLSEPRIFREYHVQNKVRRAQLHAVALA
jgi:hypothetical protein